MRRPVLAIVATIVLAGCGGDRAPAGHRRASLDAGISIAVPRGWHAAGSRITALVYPVDRLLLTSYRAQRGGNCAPDRAEEELPGDGVLAYLFEYRPRVGKVWPSSFRRSDFPPRPAHF